MRCRGSRPRCRRCGSASPAGSRAPTIRAAPATTFTTTTISATTSTAAGSTATWSTPAPTSAIRSDSLERAQHAKLDLVCRKLRLRPGDSVVEAGCGWGALAIHMARHYGARVRAFNVSREQLAYARARAGRESARRRVEFIETTTAMSAAGSTPSSRSGCSSTSARATSAPFPTSCAGPSGATAAAGCCTSSAATSAGR